MAMGSPIFFLPWPFTQFYLHPPSFHSALSQAQSHCTRKPLILLYRVATGWKASLKSKKGLSTRERLAARLFRFRNTFLFSIEILLLYGNMPELRPRIKTP